MAASSQSLNDLWYTWLTNYSTQVATNDLSVSGTQNAPAAGQSIATLSNVPVGTYDFYASINVSGTVAAVDLGNTNIKVGATVITVIMNQNNGITITSVIRRTLATISNVSINAVANSTAGSVYMANLLAKRVA